MQGPWQWTRVKHFKKREWSYLWDSSRSSTRIFAAVGKWNFPPSLVVYLRPSEGGHLRSSSSAEPKLPCSFLHMPRLSRQSPVSMCEMCACCFYRPLQFAALGGHLCCLTVYPGPGFWHVWNNSFIRRTVTIMRNRTNKEKSVCACMWCNNRNTSVQWTPHASYFSHNMMKITIKIGWGFLFLHIEF